MQFYFLFYVIFFSFQTCVTSIHLGLCYWHLYILIHTYLPLLIFIALLQFLIPLLFLFSFYFFFFLLHLCHHVFELPSQIINIINDYASLLRIAIQTHVFLIFLIMPPRPSLLCRFSSNSLWHLGFLFHLFPFDIINVCTHSTQRFNTSITHIRISVCLFFSPFSSWSNSIPCYAELVTRITLCLYLLLWFFCSTFLIIPFFFLVIFLPMLVGILYFL